MINDHTDAELARREHAAEMGEDPADYEWDRWTNTVEEGLIRLGFTTVRQGLDGDQETDGFSMDFAYDSFRDGDSPQEYIETVIYARHALETKA